MSGTSAKAGWLRPTVAGGLPPYDQDLEDIVQGIFVGITGIAPQWVRPFYQPEPPAQPPPDVDWMAFFITAFPATQWPALSQAGPTPGDTQIQHEDLEILCSFYGPNAAKNMAICRAGLFVAQNRDMIKALGLSFIDAGRPVRIPEFAAVQFINRIDLPTSFRRKITETYNAQPLDPNNLAGNLSITTDTP